MSSDTPGQVDRGRRSTARIVLISILALPISLTACTSDSASSGKHTLSASNSSSSATLPATGSSASTTAKSTSATSTTPKPTSSTSLRGDCPAVLPVVTVDRAVGKPLPGTTSFIVNLPDATIGQVERINCRYGLAARKVTAKPSLPLVEASVSLYDTAAHAAARVAATRETWREHGASPHAVTVAGHPAVVLTGYGSPLLVLGVGARTVVVSVSPTLVTAARLDSVLLSLAASALRGAGG